ncbi:flippase [Mucilaginibacter sp. OK098]|uniref:flippase n=1 Tax=Mucilaginibacter sp. OK098 TaxID=1855297 RepID=UPI00091D959C|nr:flippase [Mucilaginibacter sp. OK098]SHN13273.1 Membrane protein involved in the export of O-antigen and teichoic acid [Mucilaginibacter sp. OK098]
MGTIRKNFFYNLILTISNIVFPAITFPYASRILGPEGIGKVQFVNSFVQYFIFLAALGIPVYGIREVAKVKDDPIKLKALFTTLLILNFSTAIIISIIYCIAVLLVPMLFADREFYAVAILMLSLSFCNIDWFFSGLERFKFIAARSLFAKVIFLILLFFLVKGKSDAIYYLLVTVGGAILNNLWNIYSARSYIDFKLYNWSDTKKHLKPLLYIFSTVVAASIYASLDTIILGFLKGFKAVGYYASASRINKITIPFLTSLSTVLMPQIAHAFKNKELDKVRFLLDKSFDFVIILGIPMTIGLIVLAPELVVLFSGPEFSPAVSAMQIMAPVVLIIGLSTVWAVQILTPTARDKENSIAVICGLIVSVALNFILIPRFSYLGATIANLFAELFVMCGFAFFASKVIKLRFNLRLIIQTLLCSLLFIPVLKILRFYLKNQNIKVCILGMCCCSLVYFFFQVFIFKNEYLKEQTKRIAQNFYFL